MLMPCSSNISMHDLCLQIVYLFDFRVHFMFVLWILSMQPTSFESKDENGTYCCEKSFLWSLQFRIPFLILKMHEHHDRSLLCPKIKMYSVSMAAHVVLRILVNACWVDLWEQTESSENLTSTSFSHIGYYYYWSVYLSCPNICLVVEIRLFRSH